ncbi:MAG: hypothetical protein EBX41_05350 [Chitinophagia bacterium]|nr:hypothetical protein [Chitinophagia bacterium]
MKKVIIYSFAALTALLPCVQGLAGNKDRVGQSGAPELITNPWARSTGLFALNTAYIGGIEAMKSNIAGLAADTLFEVGLSHGAYLSGTGININNIGIAQPLGNEFVLGINVMSISFGDIPATNYYNPDGFGTFHPQFLNVQLGLAKGFGIHTKAGFAMTYVSEQINNINALGLAFDGGIQYVTGTRDNFHLGINLRNLGTNMRYTGSGFAINVDQTESSPFYPISALAPSDKFALPTCLSIGGAYDFYLDEKKLKKADAQPEHKLTAVFNFTSNSFLNDNIGLGAEYTYKEMFSARAAYRYENGIGNDAKTTTMYTGLSMGVSAQYQIADNGPRFAFDYSFRPTRHPANGVHMLGIRFMAGSKKASSKED